MQSELATTTQFWTYECILGQEMQRNAESSRHAGGLGSSLQIITTQQFYVSAGFINQKNNAENKLKPSRMMFRKFQKAFRKQGKERAIASQQTVFLNEVTSSVHMDLWMGQKKLHLVTISN